MARNHIQHYRTKTIQDSSPKQPDTSELFDGEIAINYADGNERIFIKNDNEDVVSFVSKEYIENNFQTKIPTVSSTETSVSLDSNKYYNLGSVSSLTITLNTPTDESLYNEYMGRFTVSTDSPTITFPSTITWAITPSYTNGKTYEFSIVNNLGLIVGFG